MSLYILDVGASGMCSMNLSWLRRISCNEQTRRSLLKLGMLVAREGTILTNWYVIITPKELETTESKGSGRQLV